MNTYLMNSGNNRNLIKYNGYMIKVLKVRVKDKHSATLESLSRKVNFVWNYANDLSSRSISERRTFLSSYDLQNYTAGSSKELGLHSHTIKAVCAEYAKCRIQAKKRKLGWRKSRGSRRSLGWIPIPKKHSAIKSGFISYYGMLFDIWDSYGLDKHEFGYASFNEDAQGRWYFNVCVEVSDGESTGTNAIGVDLGLKDTATCSDGTVLESGRFYRDSEEKLAKVQRANKKKRIRNIHAKIKNRRKDALHKFSRELVNRSGEIIGVTFLVVHPRLVTVQYGNAYPQSKSDYDFLKQLRASSKDVVANVIGSHSPDELVK